jgi:hypothetical protein
LTSLQAADPPRRVPQRTHPVFEKGRPIKGLQNEPKKGGMDECMFH